MIYNITVKNTGKSIENIDLSIANSRSYLPTDWSATLSSDSVQLASGATSECKLTIHVASSVKEGDCAIVAVNNDALTVLFTPDYNHAFFVCQAKN